MSVSTETQALNSSSTFNTNQSSSSAKNLTDTKAHQNNDQSNSQNIQASRVIQFYKGQNLLITGASGFLGKVLLWKILESCPDVGTIYLLMRSKYNLSAQDRLAQMLKNKPFNLKRRSSDELGKLVAIESDLTAEGLGLSQVNRELLQEKVNIVIHSAASIKFDAPLKDNLRDNVYGTCSMLKLCDSMKNLKSMVHVSTAYSNCHLKEIQEDIIPLERDIDDAVRSINNSSYRFLIQTCLARALPDEVSEDDTKEFLEGRPNTYTYTKAIAEHYVAREEGKFPLSIVRPSIVIPAHNEPCPGWVDNVNGICGLGCLAAIGLLRDIDWNYYSTSDMVPVDLVANCIICSAYQVYQESPKKILVYNMTSGCSNPISWGQFFSLLKECADKTPTNKIIRPVIDPPKHKRANPTTFLLTKFFSELLFAYAVDLILAMIGYKKILVKITSKMHNGYKILLPFTTNEWTFRSNNVSKMSDSLSPVDRSIFKFDMRGFDWKEQAANTWVGGRTYVLKDEPTEESYQSARRRRFFVIMIHYGFMIMAVFLLFLTIAKLFY